MSKVMDIYVKFTKTTHQIWSCHMTLASNSENFHFSPNSVLNFKVCIESVPLYHFKLSFVVPHMAVKEFFWKLPLKMEK